MLLRSSEWIYCFGFRLGRCVSGGYATSAEGQGGNRLTSAWCARIQLVQAVPSELKIQQEYKDLLMENTEKVLLSVNKVHQGHPILQRRE